jgi:hypothetical protein
MPLDVRSNRSHGLCRGRVYFAQCDGDTALPPDAVGLGEALGNLMRPPVITATLRRSRIWGILLRAPDCSLKIICQDSSRLIMAMPSAKHGTQSTCVLTPCFPRYL